MGTESRVTENETREFGMGDGMQPGFGNDGLLGDVWGGVWSLAARSVVHWYHLGAR